MNHQTISYVLSDEISISPVSYLNTKGILCLYFDQCFFLHGTEDQLRRFAELILAALPKPNKVCSAVVEEPVKREGE